MPSIQTRRGTKSSLVLALAAISSVVSADRDHDRNTPESPGFCNDLAEFVSELHGTATVTPFCSSFLAISTPTMTVTETVTDPALVSTCYAGPSPTATPHPWNPSNNRIVRDRRAARDAVRFGATPAATTAKPSPPPRPRSQAPLHLPDGEAATTPSAFKSQPPQFVATACSCLGLKTPSPVTVTATSTAAGSTTLMPAPSATFVREGGSVARFDVYAETNFMGGDAHIVSCGTERAATFRYGEYERSCNNVRDCAKICALVNKTDEEDDAEGSCRGFTYGGEDGLEKCHIKSEVPDGDLPCDSFIASSNTTAAVVRRATLLD